jgi:cystathionine beta-synthase
VYLDQLNNPANPEAHFRTTGPEIWEQTEGLVTHLVAGAGTGGTISGAGRFLKSVKPNVRIIAADPFGSVYHDFFKYGMISEAHGYLVEGIGEDVVCDNVQFEYIDDIVQFDDSQAFNTARRLAKEEGIFAGGSSGAAVHVALEVAKEADPGDVIVAILPDSGSKYLTKFYNDQWMKEHGFL